MVQEPELVLDVNSPRDPFKLRANKMGYPIHAWAEITVYATKGEDSRVTAYRTKDSGIRAAGQLRRYGWKDITLASIAPCWCGVPNRLHGSIAPCRCGVPNRLHG